MSNLTDSIRRPVGRVSSAWHYQGYQEALRDIQQKFNSGGEAAALQWIKDNLNLKGTHPCGCPDDVITAYLPRGNEEQCSSCGTVFESVN